MPKIKTKEDRELLESFPYSLSPNEYHRMLKKANASKHLYFHTWKESKDPTTGYKSISFTNKLETEGTVFTRPVLRLVIGSEYFLDGLWRQFTALFRKKDEL